MILLIWRCAIFPLQVMEETEEGLAIVSGLPGSPGKRPVKTEIVNIHYRYQKRWVK